MKIDHMEDKIDEMGEAHVSTSANNPLREDAFEMSNEEKIALINKDWDRLIQYSKNQTEFGKPDETSGTSTSSV
jgi:hypothetical protein